MGVNGLYFSLEITLKPISNQALRQFFLNVLLSGKRQIQWHVCVLFKIATCGMPTCIHA